MMYIFSVMIIFIIVMALCVIAGWFIHRNRAHVLLHLPPCEYFVIVLLFCEVV